METNLEIEFKTKINHDEHLLIHDYFPFSEPVLQVNTYYDTKQQDLFKKGIMCRIRKVNDQAILTIKEPQELGVMEYEAILKEDFLTDENAALILKEFNIEAKDLEEITYSSTVRYEYKDAYGIWCLDITQFKHHKDFELEYELFHEDPQAEKHYLQTLQSIGIEYEAIEPKYLRALRSSELKDQ